MLLSLLKLSSAITGLSLEEHNFNTAAVLAAVLFIVMI